MSETTTTETISSYGVVGMTCEHCVGAVTCELSKLPGVHDVAVDLVAGGTSIVTLCCTGVVDSQAVAAAVDEAGYELERS
ncbi:MAG: heavy-metal-associated domain-containing protein [Nocardioidaceae bacterium]